MQDNIEHALNSFDVATISKAKHLPVTDKCLDFPSFSKCDVYLINASLKYPCTDEQIRQVLGSQARLPLANIVVVPKNSPEELRREEEAGDETKTDKKSKSILEKEIENVESGQPQVGQKRIDSMLKDLKSTKFEFEKTEKASDKSTNDLPQNNTSIVRKGKK